MNDIQDLLIVQGSPLPAALAALDRTGMGFLFVVDAAGRFRGTVTDGDIRRALLRGVGLEATVDSVMPPQSVTLPVDAAAERIRAALKDNIAFVPLIDQEGRPVDYATQGRNRRVPVMEPLLDGNELTYVQECVTSGWISSRGRFVGEFERAMADFHAMPHALAVSNGTVALHLALVSLGIGPGDEVIVPDLTFAATASAVMHAGATPVFVDVDEATWGMTRATVEPALTSRTRAIIPVHLYGHPCEMTELMALARARGLAVIEDCAEALGARAHGQLVGTFGDAACFSFFGNKTLTTGEGGAILFRDAAVFERAQMLRDHGMSRERRYWHLEPGFNYRLTNLQAAVGVAQFERVESILERKRLLAKQYAEGLQTIEGVILPPRADWADPTCWLYTVRLDERTGLSRDSLAERLLLNGIETRPVFYPLHEMPAYQQHRRPGEFPVTDAISRSGLSLPSSVTLRDQDVAAVIDRIAGILRVRRLALDASAIR